ncbi:MAG: glycine betaine/L-proline ABC transporter substrate-binding protein ProX [Thiolinea sp.]
MLKSKKLLCSTLVTFCLTFGSTAMAADMPGEGVTVIPGQSGIEGELFQTLVVMQGLRDLGYDVKEMQVAKYPALHISIANGDVTFLASHWRDLHQSFYDKAGGDEKLSREGILVANNAQGYLIDKKTAEANNITNLAQLRDPEIAKLFDANGDGKADLAGCVPGWGCEKVIEKQMDASKLRDTVTHNQGEYSAMIADTIARYKQGGSILYYTWTPYWVSGKLVPGKDVVWLQVPTEESPDTALSNDQNYGFMPDNQSVVVNKKFVDENPAAASFLKNASINVNDVSAENMAQLEEGQKGLPGATMHAEAWIKANSELYNSWLEEARAAAE